MPDAYRIWRLSFIRSHDARNQLGGVVGQIFRRLGDDLLLALGPKLLNPDEADIAGGNVARGNGSRRQRNAGAISNAIDDCVKRRRMHSYTRGNANVLSEAEQVFEIAGFAPDRYQII